MLPASPPQRSLASFYERHLAIVEGAVLEWGDAQVPRRVRVDAVHVAVARAAAYAIDGSGRLFGWTAADAAPCLLLEGVAYASAGESSVLAITNTGLLRQRKSETLDWIDVAESVHQCWVGDSSDYYVTRDGHLYVAGLAHRGQYGDGQLAAVDGWTAVAEGVACVCAHTGHAVLLKADGMVEGTGGNRFGPLGTHGFGDKADRWGAIFNGAAQIATGARHTVAVRADGSLWQWGEHIGLAPSKVQDGVTEVACGDRHTLTRTADGRLWCWATGESPRTMVL